VLGDADAVFLAVKAHDLPPLAPRLGRTLGAHTAVVTAQNGLPWWYFERTGGPLAGTRLRSVDPDGVLAQHFPIERVIGCVVWPATRRLAPNVVEHVEGNRFALGEPDGSRSARCQALAAALTRAGLRCPVQSDIRRELWLKLLGNVAMNPISALTRATLLEIATFTEARRVARAIMEEADGVAKALGVSIPISIEQRLAGSAKVGAHKTSMLQDLEAGRPLELEALVGAVVEVAELLSLPVPHLRTVYACTKLLARLSPRQTMG
jgi:2-dehydropantoate 2-reductase